ncbi:MAG TPA: amino acid adenylation domain-containing protein [Kofleriaceae bacterium]
MAQRDDIADLYPLAPLQRGLLFHSLYAPEAAQYFEQLTCQLTGPVDPERFVKAWQEMVDRHPILRSAFISQSSSEPVQVVMKRASLPVVHHDWREAPAGEQARRFEALLAADQAEGFKLHRPPLLRIALVRIADETWQLVVSHHHLLLDGWSLPVLLGELFAVYHAAGRGRAASLPPARPYSDYIAWLGRQDRAASDAFWRATLGDLTEATPLAIDLRAAEPNRPADRVITRISHLGEQRTEALRALAREVSVTLNTVIQAAWALILGRHGRSNDVVFGVTMSGRPAELPGADQMIGLFINTLPLRLAIDPARPIRDWLPDIQRRQSDVQRFDYVSLTDVHGHSGVPRGQPLFRTLYAFENFPLGDALDAVTGDIQIRDAHLAEKTNYPLTLVVVPGAGLQLKLSYDCDRIPDSLASGMLDQLAHVLAAIAARPDAAPRDLGLMPAPAPRAAEPVTGSGPVAAAPSLAAAWRAAAARFPERIAVTDGERALSYRALDARAAAIAQVLRARGAAPDTMIGVLADRSADLIAAMLGVVLAGAAYVPLDPRYPTERLRFLAEDSGCLAILASTDAAARAGELGCPVIDLASIGEPRADEHVDLTPARDRAAYVIYTSGSTGRPKGVVVTQDNLLRLFSSTHLWFGFDEHDVWTFFHSFAFDFSVWELWGALLHGGRVVVVAYDQSRDPDAFYELLGREHVTVLNQTPSAFAQLMAAEERRAAPLPLALRTVVFGGEALDPVQLAPWFARHGDRTPRLINMYGITETTVHVTYRPITIADTRAPTSLIGRPIPDLELRLCDAHGHLVPDGVPGEICVAGAGVARGYLNRAELTGERFIADRFAADPHARLYRSGDLGRRMPDGDIEYLGRIDFQVKVRGFRIELAEIEHALATHPALAGTLVLAVGDGADRRLAAYVVVRPGATAPTAAELGEHVRRSLPDHMVPELYVALDAFPLTLQGKLDRQALPDARQARIAAGHGHVAPETPAQAAICRIWQELLGAPQVGIDDDYFALGGDSIRAIRVVALARKAGVAITLRDLFAHTTPRRLAEAAGRTPDASELAAAAPLPDAPFAMISDADRAALPDGIVDAYPLARLQAGMLFHSDAPADSRLYHDVFTFRLRLAHDEAAWRAAIQRVIAIHPVLRTSFHFDGYSAPLQLVHRTIEPPLHVEDLRGLDEPARAARLDAWFEDERRTGYDWAQPGLWRVGLGRVADDVCELVIACHHAILDGWSLATLMAELAEHYLYALGRRPAPPVSPDHNAFRDFVALEQRSEADGASQAFWDASLGDAPATRIPRWPGEGLLVSHVRSGKGVRARPYLRCSGCRLCSRGVGLCCRVW